MLQINSLILFFWLCADVILEILLLCTIFQKAFFKRIFYFQFVVIEFLESDFFDLECFDVQFEIS